jgi:hypothetical protein
MRDLNPVGWDWRCVTICKGLTWLRYHVVCQIYAPHDKCALVSCYQYLRQFVQFGRQME